MIDYRIANPDIVTLYLIIMSLCFLRIILSMVYSDTFGSFVQISLRMLIESVKFFIMFIVVILFFAIMGFMLFNDIEAFSDLYEASVYLFGAALGAFELDVFKGSELTGEFTGKIYLILYLVLTAVLLLNFLIAIMTGTFEHYNTYKKSLKMVEIVQLRSIYSHHPYYQCLVKCPTLFSLPILVLSPIIVLAKSRPLNHTLVMIEATIVIILSKLFYLVTYPIMLIFTVIFICLTKLRWITSRSVKITDFFWRIIDLVVFIFLSPVWILLAIFMMAYIDALEVYNTNNIKKIVEVNKTEYKYINKAMDGSMPYNEGNSAKVEAQKDYFAFKGYVAEDRETMNGYDPDNIMISEVIAMVLVATLKIMMKNVQTCVKNEYEEELSVVYLPTSYVVKQFYGYMFISEHLNSIIFGANHSHEDYEHEEKFNELIRVLADSSLGGLNVKDETEQIVPPLGDGRNFITHTALMTTHSQRVRFWKNKLLKLFTESNKQWLLDQFKYCKWLLLNNSYKMTPEEVPQSLKMIEKVLGSTMTQKELNRTLTNNKSYFQQEKSLKDINQKDKDLQSEQEHLNLLQDDDGLIKIFNLNSLVGHVTGFERKSRRLAKDFTKNGTKLIDKKDLVLMNIKNGFVINRFLSSSLSTNFNAFKEFMKE